MSITRQSVIRLLISPSPQPPRYHQEDTYEGLRLINFEDLRISLKYLILLEWMRVEFCVSQNYYILTLQKRKLRHFRNL